MLVNFSNGEVNQLTAEQFHCINREHTSGLRTTVGLPRYREKCVTYSEKCVVIEFQLTGFPFFVDLKRFLCF